MREWFWSFLLFLSTAPCGWASEPVVAPDWHSMVQWDNDLLTGTDRGYTNGARIAFAAELPASGSGVYPFESSLRAASETWGGGFLDVLRFSDGPATRFEYGISLTQLMFTPEDPTALLPPAGQRPYAGWLGLEFSLQASGAGSANTATLSIGTTGQSSLAKDAQEWVHENISDSPIFQGWDRQAPGELTLNLHLDHKRRIGWLKPAREWPLAVDGFYEWGTALGNFQTNAYVGTHWRFGYNLPERHMTPRVQLGSFTEAIFEAREGTRHPFSLYGFAGLRGYGVLHDITLSGPLFRDWSESVSVEPWVGEVNFGLAARWQGLVLSLSHTVRSDEFRGQAERSRYGSVMLRVDAALW